MFELNLTVTNNGAYELTLRLLLASMNTYLFSLFVITGEVYYPESPHLLLLIHLRIIQVLLLLTRHQIVHQQRLSITIKM